MSVSRKKEIHKNYEIMLDRIKKGENPPNLKSRYAGSFGIKTNADLLRKLKSMSVENPY